MTEPLKQGEEPRRKNYFLYQSKIDKVKDLLGADSETAAINEAMNLVIYGNELAQGTRAMVGEEYVDVLGIAHEVPSRRPDGG